MTAAPPTALEAHLGYWLRMVSNAVSYSFARKVETEDVTVAEWVFLRALYEAEPISPSGLAQRLGMTKGAISKLADRLAKKTLVARTAAPDDGRGQTLSLKPSGRALAPRLAVLADDNDAEFFRALTPGERGELERLLKKIAQDRRLTAAPTD